MLFYEKGRGIKNSVRVCRGRKAKRGRSAAQIGFFHCLVLQQLLAGAGGDDLACLQHIAPVGHGQGHLGVLLHQQDGGAVLVQVLDDLNDLLGLSLESEDYDSIGGFMIGMLDHLPEQGEEVTFQNLRLVADQVDGNRIDKVHIYLTEEPKEQPEEETAKN